MRWPRLLLALALLPGCSAHEADGRWLAETIDGRPISGPYAVFIKDGRVAGGHDGCNAWSTTAATGLIVADLQECPPTVAQRAYAAAVRGEGSAVALQDDGRLRIDGGGHRVLFRRQPKA